MTEIKKVYVGNLKYDVAYVIKQIDEYEDEDFMYDIGHQMIYEKSAQNYGFTGLYDLSDLKTKETEFHYLLKIIYLKKLKSIKNIFNALNEILYFIESVNGILQEQEYSYYEIIRFFTTYNIDILEKYNYNNYISLYESYYDKSIILCIIIYIHNIVNNYNKNEQEQIIINKINVIHLNDKFKRLYPQHYNFIYNNYIGIKFLYLIKHNYLPPELINLIYESYTS